MSFLLFQGTRFRTATAFWVSCMTHSSVIKACTLRCVPLELRGSLLDGLSLSSSVDLANPYLPGGKLLGLMNDAEKWHVRWRGLMMLIRITR
jgi:hypothetical protein